MNILLVDDSELIQQLIIISLKGTDYALDIANNGVEAVEAVADKNYDLILMDSQMPVMDGIEATIAIRENETDDQHTPIIAFTGDNNESDRQRYLAAGMDDCLEKPALKDAMLAMFASWMKSEN